MSWVYPQLEAKCSHWFFCHGTSGHQRWQYPTGDLKFNFWVCLPFCSGRYWINVCLFCEHSLLLNLWNLRAASFTEGQHECGPLQGSTLGHPICFCNTFELHAPMQMTAFYSPFTRHTVSLDLHFTHSIKVSELLLMVQSLCRCLLHVMCGIILFLLNSNFTVSLQSLCLLTFESILHSAELENNTTTGNLKIKRK